MRMGLTRRLLAYGAGMLLLSFAVLEAAQHLIFGLTETFVHWHLLYVAGFILLLLGPLWWFLLRRVLRPLARLVEANRRVMAGREAEAFIPHEEITDDEMGEVMRTRNETLKEVLQRNRRLSVLYTIDRAAAQSLDLGVVLNEAVEATLEALRVEAGGILLLEPDGETMTLSAHRGLSDEFVRNVQRIKLGEGVSGLATAGENPVVLNVSDYPTGRLTPFIVQEGFQTLASTPLVSAGKLIGALNLGTRRPRAFPPEELELLTAIGRQLGGAVRNAQLYKTLQQELAGRKQTEGALRESEERLRSLFETMSEGVVWIASDGQINRANPAAEGILGLKRSEIENRNYISPVWEVFRPDRTPMPPEEMAGPRAMKEKRPVKDVEMGVKHPDGAIIWINASAVPFINEAGAVEGVVASFFDITERKQLEQQLFQAQKMEAVGTLAGGVAHDFNNLLTSIIGFAQMAEFDETLSPQTREYISRVPEQGKQAARLISQLLTFSRKAITEKQPMSLTPLVKEAVKMLERTVPEHVAIRLNIPGEVASVNADPTQMQQVLMNLCVNASHAMPGGGELTIGLENATLDEAYCRQYAYAKPGSYVCLSVRDTGVGMTPEVQARIFEPFFTTKGVGEGTGLGLAVVYGIVKGHEGHINVYSEVGRGSEFKVYFPAIAVETTPRVVSAEEHPPGGTETLLLVEDDSRVLATGQAMLERLGYTVLTASNGGEALRVYRERQGEVALVVTDMVMPGMGGKELCLTLKQVDPAVKTLLMTGYSLKEEVDELRAKGVNGFVQKPFDFNLLGRAVRKALDK